MEDGSYKKSKLTFWDDIYGIDMSCIKPAAMGEPLVDTCEKKAINSSHCKVFEIDIYTVRKEDLDFSNSYELTFFRNDTVHGLMAWFDIYFDKLPNKVEFSTSPYGKHTHWKQVVFYTDYDIFVEKGKVEINLFFILGEVLKGSLAVRKSQHNFRELDIKMSFHHAGRSGKRDWLQQFKLR
jgi:protein arginine N-methyltransferase 1